MKKNIDDDVVAVLLDLPFPIMWTPPGCRYPLRYIRLFTKDTKKQGETKKDDKGTN